MKALQILLIILLIVALIFFHFVYSIIVSDSDNALFYSFLTFITFSFSFPIWEEAFVYYMTGQYYRSFYFLTIFLELKFSYLQWKRFHEQEMNI